MTREIRSFQNKKKIKTHEDALSNTHEENTEAYIIDYHNVLALYQNTNDKIRALCR